MAGAKTRARARFWISIFFCAHGRACRPVLLLGLLLLAGCANGDFERIRPSLVSDGMHDWVGRDAVGSIGAPASEFRLTDNERVLRDRAFALIAPPYERGRWDSVVAEYGLDHEPGTRTIEERKAYLAELARHYRSSEASSYAQLIKDARNDEVQLEPFFAVAARVSDMDRRRVQSLAFVSRLTDAERNNALVRNAENAEIVAWVCRALMERASAYRYALERLVISVPASEAAEADRSLNLFARQLGRYCAGATKSGVVSKG